MGSSSIGCGGQNSLEAESLRLNAPFGERINDDDESAIERSPNLLKKATFDQPFNIIKFYFLETLINSRKQKQ